MSQLASFLDATQAFYAVLRSFVVAMIESDEAVAYLFAQLKLPASALDEFRAILAQGPCLNQDIASTFSACHFTVRGSSLLGGANKGTRPGHPYADVVFSYVFHTIIESLAVDLNKNGLRPFVPTARFDSATGTLEEGSVHMPIVFFLSDDFSDPSCHQDTWCSQDSL